MTREEMILALEEALDLLYAPYMRWADDSAGARIHAVLVALRHADAPPGG